MDELLELIASELAGKSGLPLRVDCNKIRKLLDQLDPLPPPETRDELKPMTPGEAEVYGSELMGYGLHGHLLRRDVPREYREWLCDEKRAEWREMRRFMLYEDEVARRIA